MDSPDLPRQFARTRRFSLGVPRGFTVSPDGERVLFVRSTAGDDPVGRLWVFEDGAERLLVDPLALGGAGPVPEAERVRRERAREASQGVVGFATDLHARVAAFALGGALWVVETAGGAPRRIRTAGPVVDPRPSPDGTLVSYVTGGALRVVGIDGTGDRALAEPEHEEITYGLADHVAAESMGRQRGFWWSPGSDALLVARVDTSPVQRWWLSDPAHPERPPRAIRYPAAGTANAETSLHVLRLDGTRTEVRTPERVSEHHDDGEWTDDAFEYVPTACWDAHGPLVTVQTRDQRSLYVLEVDPETGRARMVSHQRDRVWLELMPGTPLRLAGGRLVRPWRLPGHTRGLRVGNTSTPPGLHVREVLGGTGERVWFTGSYESTEVHVWSLDLADDAGDSEVRTGTPRRITEGPGVHTAAVGGDAVVLDSRTPEGQSVTVLRGGEQAGRIAVLAEEPVVMPRPRHLALGKRELRSTLYLPSWHAPGSAKLPVLLCPYAGPGIQLVVHARGWWTIVAQWFAEQGYAVLITDGRGTPGRGEAWEKAVHGDQLTPVLDDQVDALHAAAEHFPDDLDLARVGIRGWSFGGFLAAGAVLHRPDVFHTAVAGAAPTDLRLYDTHWKERYLGHPDIQAAAYETCSLVAHAHRLERPLMLVHGLSDDNVLPVHTLRFSAALLAAGRPHTVLPLPGASHLVTREDVAANLLRLELDFLGKTLNV
ncbi:S9 family peptidase [Streptomyces formicae]|uniref:Peptidase n=1 Tax=Streptomyces formicae TaxID=1616117 RepID=A0A291Q2Y9_9ACTN|nr:prolyl oligopeptidase family serine peptidase [Streptomyces formicae]ATL26101.1 peptidase [Streptomyces formicae]